MIAINDSQFDAEVLNSKEGDEYIAWANSEFKKRQQILVEGLKKLGWKYFLLLMRRLLLFVK